MGVSKDFENRIEGLGLRDDIGHAGNIRALIRSCYSAADDPLLFACRVDILRRSLPLAVKTNEDFQDRLEECTQQGEPMWRYSYWGGVALGTRKEPVLGSPWLEEGEVYTDWNDVFELCLDYLEQENVTWKKDESSGPL